MGGHEGRRPREWLDHGAAAANYVESLGAERDGDFWNVRVRENVSGREFTVRARALVNACGPYVDARNADDDDVPVADSLARLIAATRQTALAPAPHHPGAEPRRSAANAPAPMAIRPRPRQLSLAEDDEPAARPRIAAPAEQRGARRRPARPTAVPASDTTFGSAGA